MKKLFVFLLLGVFMLSFASAFDWNDGTSVSYYRLDDNLATTNVIDGWGINNGTLIGGNNTDDITTTGKINSALEFEGSSEYVNTSLSVIGNFSYSSWIYFDTMPTGGEYDAIAATDSLNTWVGVNADGHIRLHLNPGGTYFADTAAGIITAGSWYHIVVTWDGTTPHIYVNSTDTSFTPSGSPTGPTTGTLSIGSNKDTGNYFGGKIDELGVWNRSLSASEVSELYNSDNGLPFNLINININAPSNNTIEIINKDIIFNVTSTIGVSPETLSNITLYIDGTLNETKSLSGTTDTETFTKQFSTVGNRTWYAVTCDTGNTCTNTTINNLEVNFFKVNSITHNSTTFETAEETFIANVSGVITSAVLFYNGTEYATTNSNGIFTTTLQVPLGTGNKSIHWRFNDLNNSQTIFQNVSETVFTLCNATYTTRFLNISFKDEADSSVINASIPTSTFQYYLGDGTLNKTYTFINTTDNFYYEFCATPNRTLNVASFFQYKQGTAYPQRVIDSPAVEYTNTTTNTTLYLLATADGLFVTFQVINSAEQTISGVFMTAIREISGQDQTVGVGTTAASGSVTLWLNPDFVHDFAFSKAGLPNFNTSFAPTQASYTIIMGTGNTAQNSTIRGIDYSILPTNNFLENDTVYTFGFNLTSSFWDVTEYGFNLRLANGTIITGDTSSISGTQLTTNYNVTNQSIIYLDAYWLINGNFTNITQTWVVQNTAYTGWSIKTFFTDLTTYLDSGLFGLDNFGRYLIAFIIIFTSVGIMGQKFGITSPLGITSLMFGIVLFFDVVTGILPDIRGISNLPTFLAGLILALAVLNEVQSR